jgi:hypothetical protein
MILSCTLVTGMRFEVLKKVNIKITLTNRPTDEEALRSDLI